MMTPIGRLKRDGFVNLGNAFLSQKELESLQEICSDTFRKFDQKQTLPALQPAASDRM